MGCPKRFNFFIMKIKSSIKRKELRPGEQMVRRNGRLVRINKKDPRRKARQG